MLKRGVFGFLLCVLPSWGQQSNPTGTCTLHEIYNSPFSPEVWEHRNLILENGYTENMMRQALRGSYVHDSLTIAQDVPSSARTQSNVLSLWQRSASKKETVGLYTQCNVAINGATCWGLNPVVNDYDVDSSTRTGTTLFGVEIDSNVQSRSTAGASLFFGADMKAQPTNLGVIHIPAPVGAGHFRYSYGIWLDDGAVQTVGLHLGALSAAVGSSESQKLEFLSKGEDHQPHSVFVFSDSEGTLHLPDSKVTSLSVDQGTPASSHSSCVSGQIWSDEQFIYVCTHANQIKRAALSSF